MPKRHVVKGLWLGEISSVDRPAQIGAVSALMKRGEEPSVRLIKASFDEALKGNMLSEKVQDVFYKAFESWWSGKEAFRKALIDELAAGGDGSTASQDFKDWLGSLVDQALGAAKAAGAADAAELEKAFNTAADTWLAKKETTMTIKTKADLTAAIEKAQASGDKVTVGEVAVIHKAATDLKADDLLPASGPLAKASGAGNVDPALAAKVERMEKRDALTADLRKHYDGLTTDADRDAFLAKSAEDQKTELAKGIGDDPVVYTTLDGIDIRKSADPTVLALAKRSDEQARELAKSRAETEDVTLNKRASDELGNIGGDLIGKKALLKAVDGITDTATRDLAKAVLASANTVSKTIFRKSGSAAEAEVVTGADGAALSEAEAKLDELAKAEAKASGVTFEKAYSTVIQTAEGAELYKRYVEGDGA